MDFLVQIEDLNLSLCHIVYTSELLIKWSSHPKLGERRKCCERRLLSRNPEVVRDGSEMLGSKDRVIKVMNG